MAMVRAWMVFFGLVLAFVGVFGVTETHSAWLGWAHVALGTLSIATAAFSGRLDTDERAIAAPLAGAGALFLLGAVSLVTSAASWLVWWTFGLAGGYAALGYASKRTHRRDPRLFT
jgi:hypothetical protein